MALGAITINTKAGFKPKAPEPMLADISFAGDSDYPTGGTATFATLVKAALDAGSVESLAGIEVLGVVEILPVATHYPVYDKANDKLMLFVRTTGAEEAAHADLHLTTFRVAVICK
jgi:hypothetical protein